MKHKYYVLGYQMFFYFYASVKIIKLSNLFKMRHFVSLVYISNKLFYCDFIFLVIAYYQFNNMTNIILLFSKKYIYFCYFFMDKKCHGYIFLIFFNLLDLLKRLKEQEQRLIQREELWRRRKVFERRYEAFERRVRVISPFNKPLVKDGVVWQ